MVYLAESAYGDHRSWIIPEVEVGSPGLRHMFPYKYQTAWSSRKRPSTTTQLE